MKKIIALLLGAILGAAQVGAQQAASEINEDLNVGVVDEVAEEDDTPQADESAVEVVSEVMADFNKDGIKDKAVLSLYTANRQPFLVIYFGTEDGGFEQFGRYDKVFVNMEEMGDYIMNLTEFSMKANPKGSLIISTSFYVSGQPQQENSYVFRFQNGDFYYIGHSNTITDVYHDHMEERSENFLTGKWISAETDENGVRKEESGKDEKKPLQKLSEMAGDIGL